jgi:hypothetical protein
MLNFSEWLSNNGEIFWEGLRSASQLPLDKIKLKKRPSGVDEFEGEEFDHDNAYENCMDAGDDISYEDVYDEPIYDEPDEDPDFEYINGEEWEKENPKPEREESSSDEEYEGAVANWEEELESAQSDYDSAVQDWRDKMDGRREEMEEAIRKARDEAIDACVQEKMSDHESEQEERRIAHEEENPPDSHGGYEAKFEIKDNEYKVSIEPSGINFHGKQLKNVYEIYFEGPNGYSLTKNNDTKTALEIYNHLLASVTKMNQEEERSGSKVNGFNFSAADPAMSLMYQRFYTDYLRPADFLRVSTTLYLTRSYIREIIKTLPSSYKKEALMSILQTQRDNVIVLKNIRKEKELKRKVQLFLSKLVNTIVVVRWYGDQSRPYEGVMVKYDPTTYYYNSKILLLNKKDGSFFGKADGFSNEHLIKKTDSGDLELNFPPTKQNIDNVIRAIKNSDLQSPSLAPYANNLKEVLKKYDVPFVPEVLRKQTRTPIVGQQLAQVENKNH